MHIAGRFSRHGGWRGRAGDAQIQLVHPLVRWFIPCPGASGGTGGAAGSSLPVGSSCPAPQGCWDQWSLGAWQPHLGFFTFLRVNKQR